MPVLFGNVEIDRKTLERKVFKPLGLDVNDLKLKDMEVPQLAKHLEDLCWERGIEPRQLVGVPLEVPAMLELQVCPGHQMGLEYFTGNLHYRDLRHCQPSEDAQRKLNRSRMPGMKHYVVTNDGSLDRDGHPMNGFFPSVVINIKAGPGECVIIGNVMRLTHNAIVELCEGQHRTLSIAESVREGLLDGDRLSDTLSALFYVNLTLRQKRQMFADINSTPVKTAKAQNIAYDSRNIMWSFAKELATESLAFKGNVIEDKGRVGKKDVESFTLSNVAEVVNTMFPAELRDSIYNPCMTLAIEFWDAVGAVMMPIWKAKNEHVAHKQNVLRAIARLYEARNQVDFGKLGQLDWAIGGAIDQVETNAGGTNSAIPAVHQYLVDSVL